MDPAEDLLIATWQHAEHLACGHMIDLGFADAEVTPTGSDGGIDVRATGGIAQVKHFTNSPVGAPAVQQLIGAASKTVHGLFYALGGYTNAAVLLAEKHKVALFQYDLRGEVVARSKSAEQLVQVGFAPWDPNVMTRAKTTFVVAVQRYVQEVANNASAISSRLAPQLEVRCLELREQGQIDEANALLATASVEAKTILALLEPLKGREVHVLDELLRDVTRAEALLVQLARRVGLDYAAITESATEAPSTQLH